MNFILSCTIYCLYFCSRFISTQISFTLQRIQCEGLDVTSIIELSKGNNLGDNDKFSKIWFGLLTSPKVSTQHLKAGQNTKHPCLMLVNISSLTLSKNRSRPILLFCPISLFYFWLLFFPSNFVWCLGPWERRGTNRQKKERRKELC